jgi:HD superfamily phosphodiesterase
MLTSPGDAYKLLKNLGAPDRLIGHAHLVGDAADRLLQELRILGVACNMRIVELGAVLHDAGKIQHPNELSEPGTLHEQAGQTLLLSHGVQPEVARCCASHGVWNNSETSFEERIVALADKLWKGKREADLELRVIDEVAVRLQVTRWDVFERLDSAFEEIAAEGSQRVRQSRVESI